MQARGEDLIADGQQLARGLPQGRLDQDQHAVRRQQRRPGSDAPGAQRHALGRCAVGEELVQEVRGDDEVELPRHPRAGRKLDRQVRAHEARARRPVDRHHLERLPESRAQHAPHRARPGAQINGAPGRCDATRLVDLGQNARQGRFRTRRDVAGVLGAQRRVRQVGGPDQRARADEPLVNRRAALSLLARMPPPDQRQGPTPFRRCP